MIFMRPIFAFLVLVLTACSSGLTELTHTPHPPLGTTYYPVFAELRSVATDVWGRNNVRFAEEDDVVLNQYAAAYFARACVEGEDPSPEGFRRYAGDTLSGIGLVQDSVDVHRDLATRIEIQSQMDGDPGCLRPFMDPTNQDVTVLAYLMKSVIDSKMNPFLRRHNLAEDIAARGFGWFDLDVDTREPFLAWFCMELRADQCRSN